MNDNCILVFTSRDIEMMKSEGGSLAWALDAKRARTCRYLVCTWNPRGEHATARGARDHGQGFLVAPISAIEPAVLPHDPKRSVICFTEYAEIQMPRLWNGQRNPVLYTTLNDLGIDPDALTFKPIGSHDAPEGRAAVPEPPRSRKPLPLTIVDAKRGLAVHYGVMPESIEIIIRG